MSSSWKLYTIRPGDSLSRIASRECKDERLWPLIAKMNGIANANRIYAGLPLLIPDRVVASQLQQSQTAVNSRRQSVPSLKFDNYEIDFGRPSEFHSPASGGECRLSAGGVAGSANYRAPLGTPAPPTASEKPKNELGNSEAQGTGHPILEYVIGGGYEKKVYQTNFSTVTGPGWKVEVNVSGTIRIGRSGTIASMWTNTDDYVKYRVNLLKFGKDAVVTMFQGINLKFKPTSSGPQSFEFMFGSKLGKQVSQTSLGANAFGQLTYRYEHIHVDKTPAGEVRVATECKITIDPSALVAAAVVNTAVVLTEAAKGIIEDSAKILWDKVLPGFVAIGTVAAAYLLWCQAATTFTVFAQALLSAVARGATVIIPVILIPNEDLWRLLQKDGVTPQA